MGRLWSPVAGVVGVVVFVAVLLVVIVFVPPQAIDSHGLNRTDWLTHVESLRASILQTLGGLVLLGSFYLGVRTLHLNRRGQLTERFGKATEQLASESLAARLGGIYALESIAMESVEWHWSVMEVLTAFLREHPAAQEARARSEAEDADDLARGAETLRKRVRLAADLQAIATVVGRRSRQRRQYESYRLDLEGVWLAGANLSGAHLDGAVLDRAHLEGANLTAAHLEGAYFFRAHLKRARLTRAHMQGADLDQADLRDCQLDHANLRRVNLSRAMLHGTDCAFACLHDADLRDALIAGTKLDGADLTGANLEGTSITSYRLRDARYDSSTVLPEHLRDGPSATDRGRQ